MSNQVDDIINKSGHEFHYEVVNFLKTDGWEVLVSPYYTDNLTDRPREIDIIAEKPFPFSDSFSGNRFAVAVRLFIECKNISQETVFWFDKIEEKKLVKKLTNETPLRENNESIKNHHYMQANEAAKLFASNKSNNLEQEQVYRAMNQVLNSTIYYRKRAPLIQTELQTETLYYSMILCSNFKNLFKRVDIAPKYEPLSDNFLMEVNYAYFDSNRDEKNEYFLIDILEFANLPQWLDDIEKKDVQSIIQTTPLLDR